MSDTTNLKPPDLVAVQAQTRVTLRPKAGAPVFSGSTAMLESCRAPDAGATR